MKLRLRIARTVPAPLAVVLTCLSLLVFAHPAHAGYYTITSTVNNNGVTSTGYSVSVGYPSSSAITYTPASGSSAPQYTMNSTVTFTVTGTWTPSFTGDTSTPPATTNFLETANTQATAESGWYGGPSGSMQPATASGDDGLGDTATVSDSTVSDVTMYISTGTGKHLVQESGNTFTITVTIKDTATGSMMVYGQAALDVAVDTRNVSIGNNLGPTSSKPTTVTGSWTNAVPVVNPTTGNPTYADTMAPAPPTLVTSPTVSINYTASPIGSWGANSSYLWNFSISGYSVGAMFNPGVISSVDNVYTSATASAGAQEHAYIHLTDSVDGANATGNLYVRFHNQWEDFIPDVTNPTTQETYIIAGVGVQNNGSTPITPSFTETLSGTVSLQTAFSGGFTLTDLGNLGISFTPSISVSSSSATTVPGPSIPPGYYSTPDLYCYYKRDNYVVDGYGTTGYLGTFGESFDNPTPMTLTIGWTAVALIP